jgi:PAS domain-containing protein
VCRLNRCHAWARHNDGSAAAHGAPIQGHAARGARGHAREGVARLLPRLQQAQHERERDHWRFREIETRYKMLFDASTEPAVVVRVTNLRVVEANAAATKSLGLLPGPEFYPDMPPRDRKSFDAMLGKVRDQGRAPGIALRLSPTDALWSLRASLMTTDAGAFYLFQMTPMGGAQAPNEALDHLSSDNIIQRLPDGFVIVDREGVVQRANHTLLDLVEKGRYHTSPPLRKTICLRWWPELSWQRRPRTW